MVAKVSKGSTSHGEGVQVLVNEPFENENGKGQFTHKLIFIGRLDIEKHSSVDHLFVLTPFCIV